MDVEKAYQDALDFVFSFVDYSLTRAFQFAPEKFDLNRMVSLMELLGNPQFHYPVIHVAGTKGKGSVSAMCASVLHESGYRTGFYSSPHLEEFTERIQIDGQPISQGEFVDLVEEIKPSIAKIPQLTTFEITTAIGFLYFSRNKIDIAVIEVGLGGRLDATNVVNPLVSVITSLSYDHMNVLGKTLTEIATEKAGIIKPNRPVVMAPQKEEARNTIERIAGERKSLLIEVGENFQYRALNHSLDNQSLLVWKIGEDSGKNELIEEGKDKLNVNFNPYKPTKLDIPLLGQHQVENACTAFAALEIACKEGLQITEYNVRNGFKKVFWPGRFEILRHSPPIIIDSAHNRDSAQRLHQALNDYLIDQPVILIFGASEDKDIQGMFAELLPRVSQIIPTQSLHPRAMSAENLAQIAGEYSCPVYPSPRVEDALDLALDLAGDHKAILVAGSLFVAAAVRTVWFKRIGSD
jgi:dihydrofolate synthase / folylpolyglutamate synthase